MTHSDDCEYLGGVVVNCKCPKPLDRARELLAGLDRRKDERNANGDVGEWQTELNEVCRILHYLIEHDSG